MCTADDLVYHWSFLKKMANIKPIIIFYKAKVSPQFVCVLSVGKSKLFNLPGCHITSNKGINFFFIKFVWLSSDLKFQQHASGMAFLFKLSGGKRNNDKYPSADMLLRKKKINWNVCLMFLMSPALSAQIITVSHQQKSVLVWA